jgi:hypothetical protein
VYSFGKTTSYTLELDYFDGRGLMKSVEITLIWPWISPFVGYSIQTLFNGDPRDAHERL